MPSFFFRIFVGVSLSAIAAVAHATDREVAVREGLLTPRRCGCCGCLHALYDYHRELRSTYGTHVDPRNYDQTEPHYYFGNMHAYPNYYSEFGFEFHY